MKGTFLEKYTNWRPYCIDVKLKTIKKADKKFNKIEFISSDGKYSVKIKEYFNDEPRKFEIYLSQENFK